MRSNKNYSSNTAFLDLLFNTLLAFVGFFIISLLLINEKKVSTPTVIRNVDFMITVQWPYEFNDDVDTYVVDPLNHITCFNRREDGLMHLDRDDIGNLNDFVTLPNGKKIEYKENREIVSIRGIVSGEYIVNVHLYSRKTETSKGPVPVNIRLEKMNPYKLISFRDVKLDTTGAEVTVFRFGVAADGNISYVTEGPSKQLIMKTR